MDFTYTVTYMKCQSCSAKNHCDQCSEEVARDLLRQPGVSAVALDLNRKVIQISGPDEDLLLDILDDAGIFAD